MNNLKTLCSLAILMPFIGLGQPFEKPDKELRRVLSNVQPDPLDVEFLFDMTMHIAEDKFFVPLSTDLSNTNNFFYMYEEMYYSAYDTLSMETPDNLVERALSYPTDEVPVLIFNYDYITFKDDALNTPGYVQLDMVNDVLLTHSSPVASPFDLHEVFAASTAIDNQYFKTCTFVIDPGFIKYDTRNQIKSTYDLYIDFGDGLGYVKFDQSLTTHYKVSYPVSGDYALDVILIPPDASTPVNSSLFKRTVQTSDELLPPDATIDIGGLNTGVYWACSGSAPDTADTKFVIYLEGIDLLDFIPAYNRDVNRIYNEMIVGERMVELRNFGYSFVVVDWGNSRKDMKNNAQSVVELIDFLKCTYPNEHEYILIGESMGGVIARYALTLMEHADYTVNNTADTDWSLPWVPCHPELYHKTRLYISLDAPHQGANIPLAYQEMYKEATSLLFGGRFYSPVIRKVLENYFDIALGSDAAEQLLIYHADHYSQVGLIGINREYTQAPLRTQFMSDLANLGNYPQYCKKMALSDGSIYSGKQTRPYDHLERIANDNFFVFDGEVQVRILNLLKVPIYGAKLDLLSNPSGTGKVFGAQIGTWGIKINLFWFGLAINVGLNSFYGKDINAVNVNPWCTEAGGMIDLFEAPANTTFNNSNSWPGNDFPLFSFSSTNNGNGTYNFDTQVGIPWVLGAGISTAISSDGLGFDFIPVRSALDWGNLTDLPLSPDIQNEPWPGRMSNTPFDVIGGRHSLMQWPTGGSRVNNVSHISVDNPQLGAYANCPNGNSNIINREIGDELLFLNNRTLPYTARFQAESSIVVNGMSPNYSNPTFGGGVRGFYSKMNPFLILNNNLVDNHVPIATFISEDTLIYNAPLAPVAQRVWQKQTVWICCLVFKKPNETPDEVSDLNPYPEWDMFPNPLNKGPLNLILHSNLDEQYKLSIWDTQGKVLSEQVINTKKGEEQQWQIQLNLPAGLYLIELSDGNSFQQLKKIIVR